MKKWIFCTKTTYLKILKAKDQLQLGSQAMIHHLAILSLTGPCEGALQGANVRTSYTSLRTPATNKRSQHTEKPALSLR